MNRNLFAALVVALMWITHLAIGRDGPKDPWFGFLPHELALRLLWMLVAWIFVCWWIRPASVEETP